MRTNCFISYHISVSTRAQTPLAPADPAGFGGDCVRSSNCSGRVSTLAIRLSRRNAMPEISRLGAAFRRSMSRLRTRRSGMNCGRSERARRPSAVCSPSSAACTFPASCNCCDTTVRICSISASAHSSPLRDSSWYKASSATCWLCDSAILFSSTLCLTCASRTVSCACLANTRLSPAALSLARRCWPSSSRMAPIWLRVSYHCQQTTTIAPASAIVTGVRQAPAEGSRSPRPLGSSGGSATGAGSAAGLAMSALLSFMGGGRVSVAVCENSHFSKKCVQPRDQTFVARTGQHHRPHTQGARRGGDALVRGEQRCLLQRLPARLAQHVGQIGQPLARGHGERIEFTPRRQREQRRDIDLR